MPADKRKENGTVLSRRTALAAITAATVVFSPFFQCQPPSVFAASGSPGRSMDGANVYCDFKMPAGDRSYLDIQEFAGSRDEKEWFNLAYKKGYALWKIDFAQTLLKYFRDENKYSRSEAGEALTEIALSEEKYSRLSALVSKLSDEFTGIGVRVSERKETGAAYLSVLLNDNRMLRISCAAQTDSAAGSAFIKITDPAGSAKAVRAAEGMFVYTTANEEVGNKTGKADPELDKKMAEKISFNVTNRPIWEVLEGFLRASEINASVSHSIQGNLTLYIKDSNVKTVLDNICKTYGLEYFIHDGMVEIRQIDSQHTETLIAKLKYSKAQDLSAILNSIKSPAGNIIVDKKTNTIVIKDNPATLENLKKMIEALDRINESDKLVTRLITLEHADVAKVKSMLQSALTPDTGVLEVDNRTNMVILTDLESNVLRLEKIIKKLDTAQNTSKVIQCKYVNSDDLKATLNSSLKSVLGVTSDSYLIESDKTTNSLIVTASPVNLQKIETFINRLDVRTKQVLIEARIVQVNLSRDENMGVNWNRLLQGGGVNATENSVSLKTFAPIGDDGIGGVTYKVGTLSTDQLRMVIQSLQKKDNSKVIACPTIVTANRKKAFVNVETTYPVRRETVVTTTTGPVTSVTYEKQNVSVRLEVTPAINPDGYIAMEINPKVQGLAGKVDNSQPIVSTKETQTNIVAKNGHTIVIAGLIEEENSQSKTKIPFFGSLPIVSGLFQNNSLTVRKNETIIFITPRLVESGFPDAKASK